MAVRFISRPFEPTGMTSERWRAEVEPVPVLLDCIDYLTQDLVSIAALLDPPESEDHPHVVRWNGALYLSDGHHRYVRAVLGGRQTLLVRLLDLDARAVSA